MRLNEFFNIRRKNMKEPLKAIVQNLGKMMTYEYKPTWKFPIKINLETQFEHVI